MKLARLAKLERDLAVLEARFERRLKDELRACAAGRWGLFRSDEFERYDGPQARELVEQIAEIDTLRRRLGYMKPHPLGVRFLALRKRYDENRPGDPKLAAMLLFEIESADAVGSAGDSDERGDRESD